MLNDNIFQTWILADSSATRRNAWMLTWSSVASCHKESLMRRFEMVLIASLNKLLNK